MVQGRQTEAGYVQILQRSALVTEGSSLCGDEWPFQQDNAAIHNARHIFTFLQKNGIRVLGHPAFSPDLNSIENVLRKIFTAMANNSSP